MELHSSSFSEGGRIPEEYAFCVPAPGGAELGPNRNPAFTWSGVPAETRSLALICYDEDAPTRQEADAAEDEIARELPRSGFYHWVIVDIDPGRRGIQEAEFSEGVTQGGKTLAAEGGPRQGVNDYTTWFRGDEGMEGTYRGYDGPCPPPNDSIIHRYTFTLYALGVDHSPVGEEFEGAEVLDAIRPHILATASLTGTYVLNARLL